MEKWGYLRETSQIAQMAGLDKATGLHRTGLDEYLKVIFPNVNDWIHDKALGKINGVLCRKRPDYRSESLKMIVEFDGMPHYTKAKNILYDIEKTKFYESLGYKVVRIPFFIQLTQKAIKTLFDIKIEEKMFNENYPSLSIEMENTPAFLCGAGALRMARELKKFPAQYKINIDFLKKENNIFLSGVDILETLWNSKIC